MSQDEVFIEKLNLSDESHESEKIKTRGKYPRSRSDNAKQIKAVTSRQVHSKRTAVDKKESLQLRRRSLTMTDIRQHISELRTPKDKDYCSTTDNSPRTNKEQPAELMQTIRKNELLTRFLARMFYVLWKKQKTRAENFKDEVNQLHIQKSFLINLRDKESERRENITKVAEIQKTEIFNLTEKLQQLKQELKIWQDFVQTLQQENNEQFGKLCTEKEKILRQVIDYGNLGKECSMELQQLTTISEQVDNKIENRFVVISALKKYREDAVVKISVLNSKNNILEKKLKNYQENEKNLKDSLKELQNSLATLTDRNMDLKSEVKELQMKLENVEDQIKEKKLQISPWSRMAYKAARVSMYILSQVGLI